MVKDLTLQTNSCGLGSLHCCMKASVAPDTLRHVSFRPVVKPACRHGFLTSTSPRQPLCLGYKLRTNFGQRGLRSSLFKLRWGDVQVRAVRESSMQNSQAKKGSSWVSSGVLLALGGALPGLVLASEWQQVQDRFDATLAGSYMHERKPAKLSLLGRPNPIRRSWHLQISNMGPACQSTALAAVDATFIITATIFLSMGSWFGTQRYGDTPSYPGVHQSAYSCSTTYSKNQPVIVLHWPTPAFATVASLQLPIMISVGI